MKKIISIIAITVLLAGNVFAEESKVVKDTNSTMKIGIVNPVSVYKESPQGESSIKALQVKLKPKADELEKQKLVIVKKLQTLQNNAPTLTKDDLKSQHDQLIKDQNDFKTKMAAFNQSVGKQEQVVSKNFQEKLSDAVKKVAQKNNYSMILMSQAVAYSSDTNDVTKQVTTVMKNDV